MVVKQQDKQIILMPHIFGVSYPYIILIVQKEIYSSIVHVTSQNHESCSNETYQMGKWKWI